MGFLSIGVGGASNSHPFSHSDGRPKTAHTYGQKVCMLEIPSNVWASIEKAADDAGRIASHNFQIDVWNDIEAHSIKSPIEQIFLAAIRVMAMSENTDFNVCSSEESFAKIRRGGVFICPQFSVGKYTVDFLVRFESYAHPFRSSSVIVELDGHDFHDKDKRQRAYEKARDRFLTKTGHRVLHFTGSELVSSPYKVAFDVLDTVELYGSIGSRQFDEQNPFEID